MSTPIYVPVVKAKKNDIHALSDIHASNRPGIRPLLELAEYDSSDNDRTLETLARRLGEFSWPIAPYVDLYSFRPDARVTAGTNATVEGFRVLAARDIAVIPTYGFERNDGLWTDLGQVARTIGKGFCFRVDLEDLDDQAEQTWVNIIERSAEMGLDASDIDVIVDLRFVGDASATQLTTITRDFINLRPKTFVLRSLTIVGSSALKTVTSVPVNGEVSVPRRELQIWSHLLTTANSSDVLGFGDYGVIHPDFSQGAPSPNANAKIRYTRGDSIHYFRGTRLFRPSNFAQYHGLARRVRSNPLYRGAHYSAGDAEIWNCADRSDRPGNLGTWVRVDQNHHIESTIHQLQHAASELAKGARVARIVDALQEA